MAQKSSPDFSKVERDARLFVWFMTLVIASLYVISLRSTPSLLQPWTFLVFTGLTVLHIILHFLLGIIIEQPRRITGYVLFQGGLTFLISSLAQNIGMNFALFMGLLGEAIGLFGLTRRGLLFAGYYLVLLVISLIQFSGLAGSVPFLLTTIPVVLFVILFVSLYMRQNEAREQAQKLASELESANRQLAEYAAQVEELTIAAERQRLARELHDILSQGLAGLVLQLEAIKAHHEAGRVERTGEIIDQSLARARSTLADSRSAIDDLRSIPASLSEAVLTKTERFTQATGIHCDLSLALGDRVVPRENSDHLLRVLNEAMANITRHAGANQVWVRLEIKNNHLELEVRDDGSGFDPEKVDSPGHYGLLGMRERARLMGGHLEIESAPGHGTRLRLIAPLFQGELPA